jgi:hypothetical protein
VVRLPDSTKLHFKLSFEPGNLDKSIEEYNNWMKKLIELDWPILFSNVREDDDKIPMDKGIVEEASAQALETNEKMISEEILSENTVHVGIISVESSQKPSRLVSLPVDLEIKEAEQMSKFFLKN